MTNLLAWNGETYRGAPAVAKASGCSTHTVYWHLREYGNLERLGAGRWQAKSPGPATTAAKSTGLASAGESLGPYGTSASARKVSADDIDAAIDEAFRVVLSRRGGRA
ncbi:hypothetical protein [Paracoccus yeei]|uniref:hypothetical protein n=1 Tax=Paracoccus yeei TaxID=147645 RepID=UPI001C8D8142|nr:hypothetical protein [Paracoccus yeei]MBY0138382.1 hypothetical protein [Paracoccus yeei]